MTSDWLWHHCIQGLRDEEGVATPCPLPRRLQIELIGINANRLRDADPVASISCGGVYHERG